MELEHWCVKSVSGTRILVSSPSGWNEREKYSFTLIFLITIIIIIQFFLISLECHLYEAQGFYYIFCLFIPDI